MHELPLVKSIYKTVINFAQKNGAQKVTRVVLEIGVVRDFIPEIVQKYWDYVSKDSMGQGSSIEIISIPATAKCGKCGTVYSIDTTNLIKSKCPKCKFDRGTLVTGNELKIKGVEIER